MTSEKRSAKIFLILLTVFIAGVLVTLFIYQRKQYFEEVHNLKSSLILERLNSATFWNQMILSQAQQIEGNAKTTSDLAPLSLLTYANSDYNFKVKFPDLWLYREERPVEGPLKLSVVINSTRGDSYFIEVYEFPGGSPRDFLTSYYLEQGYKVSDWKEEYISGRKVLKFYTEYVKKDENSLLQPRNYSFGNLALVEGGYLYNFSSSRGQTPQEKLSNPFLESMVASLEFSG